MTETLHDPDGHGPFADILAENQTYSDTTFHELHLKGLASSAKKCLGVLTCIDSRILPLRMLGLGPGDAKIFRNAGARITKDALRSLILATHLLNVQRLMIVGHTDCAMHCTDNEMHDRLSAVGAPQLDAGEHAMKLYMTPDPTAALTEDVERLVNSPLIAKNVTVAGFLYDVETGLLSRVTQVRRS